MYASELAARPRCSMMAPRSPLLNAYQVHANRNGNNTLSARKGLSRIRGGATMDLTAAANRQSPQAQEQR